MTLRKRLVFFGGGALMGTLIALFILDKKDVTFDYGPNARVLKTLRTKQRVFDQQAYQFFVNQQIDTSNIELFLTEADVVFSKSKPREKPCNFYHIETKFEDEKIGLYVKNCDTLVSIQKGFKLYE
jgi:pyrroline-5-carboxylate reductase